METKFIGIVSKYGEFLSELKLREKKLSYEANSNPFLHEALLTPSVVLVNKPEQLDDYKHMAKMVKGRLVEVEVTYTVRDIETGEEVEMVDADKRYLRVEANKNSGGLVGSLLLKA